MSNRAASKHVRLFTYSFSMTCSCGVACEAICAAIPHPCLEAALGHSAAVFNPLATHVSPAGLWRVRYKGPNTRRSHVCPTCSQLTCNSFVVFWYVDDGVVEPCSSWWSCTVLCGSHIAPPFLLVYLNSPCDFVRDGHYSHQSIRLAFRKYVKGQTLAIGAAVLPWLLPSPSPSPSLLHSQEAVACEPVISLR